MDLSIIIPTFNSEKYLNETLNSIIPLLQILDAELVIVDDGSTDNTRKIIAKYKKQFKVRAIYNSHKGAGYSRNIGIINAVGDYITFIDSDDLINAEKYLLMMQKARLDENINIISMSAFVRSENDGLIIVDDDLLKTELLLSVINITTPRITWKEYNPGPVSKIFSRDFILKNKIEFPTEIKNGEDMIFNYMAVNNSKKTLLLKGSAYRYRQTSGSLMHKVDAGFRNNNILLLNEIERLVNKNKIIDNYNKKDILSYWNIRIILTNFVRLYSNKQGIKHIEEQKTDKKELRQYLKTTDVRKMIRQNLSKKQQVVIFCIRFMPRIVIIIILRFINYIGLIGNLHNTEQIEII